MLSKIIVFGRFILSHTWNIIYLNYNLNKKYSYKNSNNEFFLRIILSYFLQKVYCLEGVLLNRFNTSQLTVSLFIKYTC